MLSALSRGTDLIPSDVIAGLILLRVQEKRERHELHRINLSPTPVRTSGMYFILLIMILIIINLILILFQNFSLQKFMTYMYRIFYTSKLNKDKILLFHEYLILNQIL